MPWVSNIRNPDGGIRRRTEITDSGYKYIKPIKRMPSKSALRSKNLVTKKKAYKKKPLAVSKSFKQAYSKLQPRKEIRYDLSDISLHTNAGIANSSVLKELTNIAQGTQTNQRSLNKIYLEGVRWSGTVQSNSAGKTKYLRFIVFQERNHGHFNQATMSDLFLNASFADTAPTTLQDTLRSPVNKEQYIVYSNRVVKLPMESEGNVYFNRYIKIGKRIYWPQAGSAGAVTTGGYVFCLALLCEGDNAPSATTIVLSTLVRTFFKD